MNITYKSAPFFRNLVLTLLAMCFTNNVFAHAVLKSSTPAANAQLNIAPPELVLEFENPIMLMKLTMSDANGKTINLNFKMSRDLNKTQKFPLPKLNDGHYNVNWTAMGKDGHNMSGSFIFMIGTMAISAPNSK